MPILDCPDQRVGLYQQETVPQSPMPALGLDLSYRMGWRARRDSNPQPSDPKSDALSIELRALPTVFFTYFQWSVNS